MMPVRGKSWDIKFRDGDAGAWVTETGVSGAGVTQTMFKQIYIKILTTGLNWGFKKRI